MVWLICVIVFLSLIIIYQRYKLLKCEGKIKDYTMQLDHFNFHNEDIMEATLEEGLWANFHNELVKLEELFIYLKKNQSRNERGVNDFIENMAHQMKITMTALQMQLDYIQMNESIDKKLDRICEAQKCLSRLEKEVDRLLKSSQLAHGKIKMNFLRIDLQELLEEVIEGFQILCKKKNCEIQIHNEVNTEITIQGDYFWLMQAFENLLKNAIEVSGENEVVKVEVYLQGASWCVSIEDLGPGIIVGETPYLFKRFYRGNTRKQGYGIGLSMSKDIVEAHHGNIFAKNHEKGGSIFGWEIPILNGKETYES